MRWRNNCEKEEHNETEDVRENGTERIRDRSGYMAAWNEMGASFDKGETFSGVPYDLGLACVEELKNVFGSEDLAPYAIRWILMHEEVSVVIPGASRAAQLKENIKAAELPPLTDGQMQAVKDIYDQKLRDIIHQQW